MKPEKKSLLNKDEEKSADQIEAIPAPHYPWVYYFTYYGLIPSAFIGLVPFGYWSKVYTAMGGAYAAAAVGIPVQIPESYGDMSTWNHFQKSLTPIELAFPIEMIGWLACGAELINSMTQFAAKESVRKMDQWLYDTFNPLGGRVNALQSWFENAGVSRGQAARELLKIMSYAFFAISLPANSYSVIEEIKEPFEKWSRELTGNPVLGEVLLGWLGVGAILYCVFTYAERMKNGMALWSKKTTVFDRFQYHNNLLMEVQCLAERSITVLYRMFNLSFLNGRMAEQWGMNATAFYTLGALGGLCQGIYIFDPGTFKKYHAYADEEFPITQEERDAAYIALYQRKLTWSELFNDKAQMKKLLTVEAKRALMIGYIQILTVAYVTINYLYPALLEKQFPEGFAITSTFLMTLIIMWAVYMPYHSANLYRDLNDKAYQMRRQEYGSHTDESDKIIPSSCAKFTGTLASIGVVISRDFSLIASMIKNRVLGSWLSDRNWVFTGGFVGAVVGDNRFHVMTDASIKTLAHLGCIERPSQSGLFARQTYNSINVDEFEPRGHSKSAPAVM